jgi:hypothetical protein
MRRTRQRKPRTVTVLQKLYESGLDFTITDLKHLNGSLYYLDWTNNYPNTELPEKEAVFEEKTIKLFEFPPMFEKKIESKIFFHFKRKSENLRKHGRFADEVDPNLAQLERLEHLENQQNQRPQRRPRNSY